MICSNYDENEENVFAEIRAIMEETGADEVLSNSSTSTIDINHNIEHSDDGQQNRKTVTAVISSEGYINVLKQKKEKKEAAEKKKKQNRARRLEAAISKMVQTQSAIDKLKKQVENDEKE